MKCVDCDAIDMNTITDFVYDGYSLCIYHANVYVKKIKRKEWELKRRYFSR